MPNNVQINTQTRKAVGLKAMEIISNLYQCQIIDNNEKTEITKLLCEGMNSSYSKLINHLYILRDRKKINNRLFISLIDILYGEEIKND